MEEHTARSKVPPVLTAESIVCELRQDVIPACIPRMVECVLRPCDVDFGVVQVLTPIVTA